MYFKNYVLLFVANLLSCTILILSKSDLQEKADTEMVYLESFSSVERIIDVNSIKPCYVIAATETDIDTLMKIVEAEAGNEDRTGKLLVADVVINRVKNASFPDSITNVVYQKSHNISQFSPVSNGKIDNVSISDETVEVVYSALRGEDISNGALYFMARKYSEPENAAWFDRHLTYLFTHGNHDFFAQ
jgi:N-acetylmuramoyl-L-alanine amidase